MGIVGIIILIHLFTRPYIFITTDKDILLNFPTEVADELSIRFIHSVQKTPVVENLIVNETCNGFTLKSTKYQSFGVGLPFLLTDGDFRQEGNYFILDNMNRNFEKIDLRTGLGTKLTIIYKEKEYPVYEKLPLGARIELKVVPYYVQFLNKFK